MIHIHTFFATCMTSNSHHKFHKFYSITFITLYVLWIKYVLRQTAGGEIIQIQ